MFFIYSLLYSFANLILFLPQYLKRPANIRGKWFNEKLGRLPKANSSIWIHAVSVGEVIASVRLLRELQHLYPQSSIIISTITDTGQRVAREKAPEGTQIVYMPFDLRLILRRAVMRTRAKVFISVETELWPNTFRTMAHMGVPVLVLNGRISEKSARGYKKISFFMKKVLSYVSEFGMQSQVDAQRLHGIGADQRKISVIGNFKFETDMPHAVPAWAASIKGPVIVAGSTHKGEEEIILSSYQESVAAFPELNLIIAPRHPERFQEAEDCIRKTGIPYTKKSDLQACSGVCGVILLDSIGELSAVYGIADIAIMGKSFTGEGGQNPLEPAYWGKAILCGPHMENFPFIKDFYRAEAAFEVSPAGLSKKIYELLADPEKAKTSGQKARELYIKNAGAVDKALQLIRGYVP